MLANDPVVLVDAAHTERSALALAASLESLAPTGFDLLISVSVDKHLDALLRPLLGPANRIWATRAEPMRSLPADLLAKRVEELAIETGKSCAVVAIEDPDEASRTARRELADGHRLVCLLYTSPSPRDQRGSRMPSSA